MGLCYCTGSLVRSTGGGRIQHGFAFLACACVCGRRQRETKSNGDCKSGGRTDVPKREPFPLSLSESTSHSHPTLRVRSGSSQAWLDRRRSTLAGAYQGNRSGHEAQGQGENRDQMGMAWWMVAAITDGSSHPSPTTINQQHNRRTL